MLQWMFDGQFEKFGGEYKIEIFVRMQLGISFVVIYIIIMIIINVQVFWFV